MFHMWDTTPGFRVVMLLNVTPNTGEAWTGGMLHTEEPEYHCSMTTFQTIATVIHILLLVGFVGAFAYLFDLV